ncbi:hypothetical protein ACHAWU_008517 [Discostella pseudostelligera]|uniref:Uncharacterized protein n=1 Tax=Discostella pseudostelligera TaxID=259834 RepID=A0ABD3M5N7_9STRA
MLALRFGASLAFTPSHIELGSGRTFVFDNVSMGACSSTQALALKQISTSEGHGYKHTVTLASNDGKTTCHMSGARRAVIQSIIGVPVLSSIDASAANLPSNLGADLTKTGTIETLLPIAAMERSLVNAKLQLTKSMDGSSNSLTTPEICADILNSLLNCMPREENSFKRIFDAYSTPVSYKQKFMDQNAFLVYYTKGYDGPGRPSIEEEDTSNTLQTLQYGARNDAWAAMDDLFVELEFGKRGGGESTNAELGNLIDKSLSTLDSYLSLAPVADVEEAMHRLGY